MGEKETLTLSVHHPPTPPTRELPFNLHRLVNAPATEVYNRSYQNNTLYPAAEMDHQPYHANQYVGAQYPDPHSQVGLGIHYHGYEHSSPGYYPSEGHPSHMGSPYMQGSMPLSSPPTPLSNHSDSARRTRSGRSIGRMDSPQQSPRKSTPPRTRNKKAGKVNEKNKTPKLTAPLSVLTKDMTNVPIRDMEAWVTRSVSERVKEAEKRNGYITRPMNSFMLYRSAYAERTKVWCLHNNHQVVSSVSGESWPLEPPEVRDFYNELARIERINHQNAHPDYKFSPSKPGATSKKRKGVESDEESEPSDPGDPEAEWGSSHRSRARASKRPGRDAGYPARANLGDAQDHFIANDGYNRSTWEANNGGRPLPVAMGHNLYQHQYYQSSIHPHPQMMPNVEDVRFNPMDVGYGSQSLIGIPGGSHHELLGLHSSTATPMMEPQVDPMLLAYDDQHQNLTLEDGLTLTQHGAYEPGFVADLYNAPVSGSGGPLVSDYQPKSWQPESTSPTFEQSSEFEKYWDEMNAMERRESAKSGVSAKSAGGKSNGAEKPKSPKSA